MQSAAESLEPRHSRSAEMKLGIQIIFGLLFTAHLSAAEGLAQKNAVLVLSPDMETAEGRVAVEKLKSDLAAQGVSVTEIPADEAQDIGQVGLIADGGPVITTESQAGKIEFKVHDGISGADITKTFKSGALKPEVKAEAKKAPEPVAVVKPEPVEQPKPVERPAVQPAPRETSAFARNHIGLSMGPSNFTKSKDSLEMLQQGNPGSQVTYAKTSGRFQLFYERDLSEKYTLGLSGEFEKGGGATWDNNGTLSVDPKHKVANVYVRRNFGRHFGLYIGGGADMLSLHVIDRGNMAGAGDNVLFKSDMAVPHAEAGVALSAGDFSLRFSFRKILNAESSELTASVNGSKTRLTIKNGNTLGTKAVGQPLGANEQLYKADAGGTAAAVLLTYSFANW